MSRAGQPSAKAREIAKQSFEKEKIGKIAMFGMHPVARVISSFVMGVINKGDMRFFKTKEDALAWLKE